MDSVSAGRRFRLSSGVVAIVMVLLSGTPGAQRADRVIGLLLLPEVFGHAACEKFTPRDVPLYPAPQSRDVAGTIRVDKYWTFHGDGGCEGLTVNVHPRGGGVVSELPTRKPNSDTQAAIVLARRGGWFKLRLTGGTGWVRASGHDEYIPLQRLILDRDLTYLTESWDRRLARQPGGPGRRVATDPARRMIGYLTPVDAFEHGGDGGPWVQAFDRPDPAAPVVARFQAHRAEIEIRTTPGRIPRQLFVFDRRPGWFQVALQRESWRDEPRVWIQEAAVWTFHAVTDEAERERLADDAWGGEHTTVRVLEFREVRGVSWLKVEVMSHSICEGGAPPTVAATGWMPAHAPSGDPTVWFSPQGC